MFTAAFLHVIDGRIIAADHDGGDPSVGVDLVVEAAVRLYQASGQAPSACGIDFGVLESGQTALVEADDGYALGAYEISSGLYYELIAKRWDERLRTRRQSHPV